MSRRRNRSRKKYINYKSTDKINASNIKQASDTQSEIIIDDWHEEVEMYEDNREILTIGKIPSDISTDYEQLEEEIDAGSDKKSCQTNNENRSDESEYLNINTGSILYDASLNTMNTSSSPSTISQNVLNKSHINSSKVSIDSQINAVDIPKSEKFAKLMDYFENIKDISKVEIKKEDRNDDAVIIPEKVIDRYKQAYIESINEDPERSKNIAEEPIERTFDFHSLMNKWEERSNLNK
jgi:hypothetical protein